MTTPNDFERHLAENILSVEKVYHIFKAILILFTTAIILLFIFYETNRSVESVKRDNELTRQYIACIAKSFTYTDRANLVVTPSGKCTLEVK